MSICQLLRICDFDIIFHCHFWQEFEKYTQKSTLY